MNDPELSFQEVLRKQCTTESIDSKDAIKLECHEDILKFDKNEILVKLEKGEGTLKIEKVGMKKEFDECKKEKVKPEADLVELTLVKNEKMNEETKEEIEQEKESESLSETAEKTTVKEIIQEEDKMSKDRGTDKSNNKDKDEMKEDDEGGEKSMNKNKSVASGEGEAEDLVKNKEQKSDETEQDKPENLDTKEDSTDKGKDESKDIDKEIVEKGIEKEEDQSEEKGNKSEDADKTDKDDKPEKDEKSEKVDKSDKHKIDLDKETDVTKQAAELKAMFPDLEVIQPLSRLSQIDTFVLRDRQGSGALDFSENTVAQLFNNAVKWPKEHAVQTRLQHICHAVEHNEWPVPKNFTAYTAGIGPEYDMSIHETPNATPKRDTSTPKSTSDASEVITITTDHCIPRMNSNKKRKRHIAIDVETERAKLHALLNSAHANQLNPLGKSTPTSWDNNDDSEESRRSTPITQNMLQPPPAHQNAPRVLSMPYDLKYHVQSKPGTSTVIPGTSSTLTPIDLSSG